MMYSYNGSYLSHMFEFGSIFMMIFLGFIIYAVISVFRHTEPKTSSKAHPVNILKERYAKGEITKEQFESMKKDLE